ncbi:MAG: Hpt domain-containing protein, partial [Candidatus Electrothrix sp. AR4]|nr:Hpt domain-containing protein [Candidatus Electrothrix sp. AR4]
MIEKLPRALPCLDIQAGIRQLEGNRELYVKLLKKFAECNLDLVCKIEENLNENDHKTARMLAHSTKGVSGSIGATDLYFAASTLESAIIQGEHKNALQDFSLTLRTVLQSIAALLYDQENNDIPLPLGKKVKVSDLVSMLEELDHYLKSGDFKALQSYAAL